MIEQPRRSNGCISSGKPPAADGGRPAAAAKRSRISDLLHTQRLALRRGVVDSPPAQPKRVNFSPNHAPHQPNSLALGVCVGVAARNISTSDGNNRNVGAYGGGRSRIQGCCKTPRMGRHFILKKIRASPHASLFLGPYAQKRMQKVIPVGMRSPSSQKLQRLIPQAATKKSPTSPSY